VLKTQVVLNIFSSSKNPSFSPQRGHCFICFFPQNLICFCGKEDIEKRRRPTANAKFPNLSERATAHTHFFVRLISIALLGSHNHPRQVEFSKEKSLFRGGKQEFFAKKTANKYFFGAKSFPEINQK